MAKRAKAQMRVFASARYEVLASKRQRYLDEARACAELTLPSLIPPEGIQNSTELVTPAQSDGARAVNGLTASFLMTFLPPNRPSFRIEAAEAVQAIIDSDMSDEEREEADKIAREARADWDRIARAALRISETFQHRPKVFDGIQHLIVGGSVCLWGMDDEENYGKMRAIPLARHVVQRDSLGFPLEIIIRDGLSASNLPPNLDEIRRAKTDPNKLLQQESDVKSEEIETNLAVYTYARWDATRKRYTMHQEFMDEIVEGSEALYKKEDCPLWPLRYRSSDSEDYGHGLVEQYRGILTAIEALAQAETASAVSLSEIRWAIDPASGIRASDWLQTPAGSPIDASPDMIKAITAGNAGDLSAVRASKEGLQRQLGLAFMDGSAIQRSGERVTAEEIKTLVAMLERAQGGSYTALNSDFQNPYVRFQLRILKHFEGVDVGDTLRTRIVTGFEALGQGAEYQQLIESQQVISNLLGPIAYAERVNADELAARILGALGIEPKGLFKSEAQLAQMRAASAQAEANRANGPAIIGAATELATQDRAA